MDKESTLSKLKKIRELATKNTELGEIENATTFYQKLLIENNITDEEVDDHSLEKIEDYAREFYSKHMKSSNVNKWKVDLAWKVARPNLCEVIIHSDGRSLAWLGKKSNIEAAQYLYETIVDDIERIADEKWSTIEALRKLERETGVAIFKPGSELRAVHGKSWKNSFYWGAVESIEWRLNENLRKLQEDKRITALVVSNEAELNEFTKKTYPKLGRSTISRPEMYSHAGFASGQISGKEVQFKKGIGAGGSHGPKLIGSGN